MDSDLAIQILIPIFQTQSHKVFLRSGKLPFINPVIDGTLIRMLAPPDNIPVSDITDNAINHINAVIIIHPSSPL